MQLSSLFIKTEEYREGDKLKIISPIAKNKKMIILREKAYSSHNNTKEKKFTSVIPDSFKVGTDSNGEYMETEVNGKKYKRYKNTDPEYYEVLKRKYGGLRGTGTEKKSKAIPRAVAAFNLHNMMHREQAYRAAVRNNNMQQAQRV